MCSVELTPWTEGADGNLYQVEEYIAQDNPPAPVATVNKNQ